MSKNTKEEQYMYIAINYGDMSPKEISERIGIDTKLVIQVAAQMRKLGIKVAYHRSRKGIFKNIIEKLKLSHPTLIAERDARRGVFTR